MNTNPSGRVASIHMHPETPGEPLHSVESANAVEGKGFLGEPRYFGRVSGRTGEPSKRHVTLIEREQLSEHAAALGLESIPPGAVRSNIETVGIDLISIIGREIEIGGAVLHIDVPRDPCQKMDAVCQGLRERMMEKKQGVVARIVRSGVIRVGDNVIVKT